MSQIDFTNSAAAGITTPSTGQTTLFIDTATKKLKSKDDSGSVTDYSATGSAITSLTGDVTATGPGAAAASIANTVVTGKTLTGLTYTTGVPQATDSVLTAVGKLANRQGAAFFGNGTDGVVSLSVDTTMIRDMYYDTLTIPAGVNLFTGGFSIHVLNTLTVAGTIDRSGNPGLLTAAGAALTAGTLGSSGAGAAGGTAAGVAGGAVASGIGGAGGTGGTGSGGAGGAAGAVTIPTAATGGVEQFNQARQASVGMTYANVIQGGGGGGGSGGGDATAGGGSGSGGGVIVICARNLTGTGTIRAKGGDGGTPATGNRGGGAGGGGGAILLVTENDTTLESFTLNVSGGLGSSGTGTGTPGGNGSVGRIFRVRI